MISVSEKLSFPVYESKTTVGLKIVVSHSGDRSNGLIEYSGPDGYIGHVDYNLIDIFKSELTVFSFRSTSLEAFAFSSLDAKPNSQGLGNILLYHLAEFATRSNVPYVCAKAAVPAAMTFYQRLGFFFGRSDNSILSKYGWGDNVGKEINNVVVGSLKEKYKDLYQKDAIINPIRLAAFSAEQEIINDIISRGFLYISSNTLTTNARNAWERNWTKLS